MKLVKALYFTSPSCWPGLAILVGQNEQGWLYVKSWRDPEALPERFSSVEELEAAFGEALTLIREEEVRR